MTDSEIHQAMTSGFATIAGSALLAYISLGVPAQNLITSSVMSIPASITVSKMRYPETEEPVTRGRVPVDRGESGPDVPTNGLHAFSQGAIFGLVVAGLIFANVLTILSLIAAISGLLTWIGKGFPFRNRPGLPSPRHQASRQRVLRIFEPSRDHDWRQPPFVPRLGHRPVRSLRFRLLGVRRHPDWCAQCLGSIQGESYILPRPLCDDLRFHHVGFTCVLSVPDF